LTLVTSWYWWYPPTPCPFKIMELQAKTGKIFGFKGVKVKI